MDARAPRHSLAATRNGGGFVQVGDPLAKALERLESHISADGALKADAVTFQARKEQWLRAIISYPNLSGADIVVAVAISTFLNSKKGYAWPSIETLADMTNRRRSTVWRSIERLKKYALLKVEKGRGRHVSNRYWPLLGATDCDPKTLRRRTKKATRSQ